MSYRDDDQAAHVAEELRGVSDIRGIVEQARELDDFHCQECGMYPDGIHTLLDELRRLAQHIIEYHSFNMGTSEPLVKHANRVLGELEGAERREQA